MAKETAKRLEKKTVNNDYGTEGIIQARVSDFAHGLRVFDDVKLIRIRSRDYTLLIMEDYFPLLGRIHGRVELVTKDELIDLGEVSGFYMHRENEFSLLINEQLAEPGAVEDAAMPEEEA